MTETEISTVDELDKLPEGTVIREVNEGVTWVKDGWHWRCIGGFVPGIGQPLLPALIGTQQEMT